MGKQVDWPGARQIEMVRTILEGFGALDGYEADVTVSIKVDGVEAPITITQHGEVSVPEEFGAVAASIRLDVQAVQSEW